MQHFSNTFTLYADIVEKVLKKKKKEKRFLPHIKVRLDSGMRISDYKIISAFLSL